jgi:O-antigen ligase
MIDRANLKSLKPPARSKPVALTVAGVGIILSAIAGLLISGGSERMYLLLAVLGLIAFVITFARLDLGAAGMVLALYTQTHFILGERYGITDVVQGLIMLLLVSMITRWVVYSPEFPQGWMRPLFLVAFYCLVCLASVMYAVTPSVATPIAIDTLKSGIIAIIIAITLKTKNSFRLAIWMLLVAGIFLGSLSVIQFASGNYYNNYGGYAEASFSNISGQTDDYRLGGPVGDPNYYAQMMLVLVPLALDRLWHESRRVMRFFAAWALGVCSFTVLLTYSRGGFISMVIVVAAMLFVFHRGQLRYVTIAAIFALLLLNFLPAQFTQRIGTLTELVPGNSADNGLSQDSSFRGRTSEMLVALRMFADYPIFGVGLGNYPLLYQQYARRVGLEFRAEVRQAHSLYLEIAAETGLLGVFSFGVLIWGIFRSVWKSYQVLTRKGLTSIANMVAAQAFGLLGFLIAASFIHAVFFRNFWVLAGIALAVPRMAQIEIENAERTRHKILQKDGV